MNAAIVSQYYKATEMRLDWKESIFEIICKKSKSWL